MTAEAEARVLSDYSRPVAHMHRQLAGKRLGLILGSGVSKPIGLPDWRELVGRISAHQSVGAAFLPKDGDQTPLPVLAQVLLQHFTRGVQSEMAAAAYTDRDITRLAWARFRQVVHECLYRDVPSTDADLKQQDRFYKHYLEVIKRSAMTVTYNFDDVLERLLLDSRTTEERQVSRGFETITDARLQVRMPQAVIYHPNGYLPTNLLEGIGEGLVFSEGSFADQLIDSMAGHYSSLLHHLSKNTCLLVGLSLEDSTLRHLLRQSARTSPGHVHYYIHYLKPGEVLDPKERVSRREANFEVFNLITLFLDDDQIAALGAVLAKDAADLKSQAEELGVTLSYCFYLTGVPGVGKTTTAAYFKNLVMYDEWLERRLPEMGKPHEDLSSEERTRVDQWVLEQVGLKNRRLLEDQATNGLGLTLVDRCVPDAIAFTPAGEWPSKAKSLLQAISPGKSQRRIHPGRVIVLTGDPGEVAIRAQCAGKKSAGDYVDRLQKDTLKVYAGDGIKQLRCNEMSVAEVAKSVARVIHLEDYAACDLHSLLERFAASVPQVPVEVPCPTASAPLAASPETSAS